MSLPEEQNLTHTSVPFLGNIGLLSDTNEELPVEIASKDNDDDGHDDIEQQVELVRTGHARPTSAAPTTSTGLGISFRYEDDIDSEAAVGAVTQQKTAAASGHASSSESKPSFRASIDEFNKKHGLVFPDEEEELEQMITEENERQAHGLTTAALDGVAGFPSTVNEEWTEELPASDKENIDEEFNDLRTHMPSPTPGHNSAEDSSSSIFNESGTLLDIPVEDTVARRLGFSSDAEWFEALMAAEAERVQYIGDVSRPVEIAGYVRDLILQGLHVPSYAAFAKYVCYDDFGYLCVFLNGSWTQTCVQPLYNQNVDERFSSERYAYDMARKSNEGGDLLQYLSIKTGFMGHYLSQAGQIGLPTEMLFKHPTIRDVYSPHESGVGIKWSYPREAHYQRQRAFRNGKVATSKLVIEIRPEDIAAAVVSPDESNSAVSDDGSGDEVNINAVLTPFRPNAWIDRENEEDSNDWGASDLEDEASEGCSAMSPGLLTTDFLGGDEDPTFEEDNESDHENVNDEGIDPAMALLETSCTLAETAIYDEQSSTISGLQEGGNETRMIASGDVIQATPPELEDSVPALRYEDIVAILACINKTMSTDTVKNSQRVHGPYEDTFDDENNADVEDLYDELYTSRPTIHVNNLESGSHKDEGSCTDSDEGYFFDVEEEDIVEHTTPSTARSDDGASFIPSLYEPPAPISDPLVLPGLGLLASSSARAEKLNSKPADTMPQTAALVKSPIFALSVVPPFRLGSVVWNRPFSQLAAASKAVRDVENVREARMLQRAQSSLGKRSTTARGTTVSEDRMLNFARTTIGGAAKTIKGFCWTVSKAVEVGLVG